MLLPAPHHFNPLSLSKLSSPSDGGQEGTWEKRNQSSAAHTSLRNSSAKGISFHNFPGTILPVLLIFKQTRKPTKGIFQESPRINPLHPRLSTGLLGFAQMCYTM